MAEEERTVQGEQAQPFDRVKKGRSLMVFAVFMLIMIGLGVSDSNRGVFSGIFERELALTKPQVSMIVTVSYVGNLLFMLFGGRAADRMDKKRACMGILGLWTLAQALFFCTDSYACLLIGMFISMGASTLMNTMINILSPYFFGIAAGLYVNVLFFVQGIGTSANQKLMGTLADGFGDYRLVCGALGLLGLVCLAALGFLKFDREPALGQKTPGKVGGSMKGIGGAIAAMGLIFGFYFVAEHGILNWWAMYCSQGLKLDKESASTSVSLFFGTMTLGRLVLAPLVQRLGSRRSIVILGGLGSAVYVLGVLLGGSGIWLLGISGFGLSIVYPTIVLFLQELFPRDAITTATGAVISVGTLFDIGFNAVFGGLVDAAGFGVCRLVFPMAIIVFYVGFLGMQRLLGARQKA